MLKTFLPIGLLIWTASSLSATSLAAPCVANTLASYEALPATGCNVGPLNFSGFTFSQSGTVTVGAAAIMVTPVTNIIGVDYGLLFTSSGFSVSGSNTSTYVIDYQEDPSGPIQSLDDVLGDPVTSPGLAEVNTLGCLGAAFSAGTCPNPATVGVSVFDNGITRVGSASVSFAGQSIVGVQNTILLEGNGTGSASIIPPLGIEVASADAPEPGSGWLCGAVLLGLLFLRKAPLKVPQIRLQRRP